MISLLGPDGKHPLTVCVPCFNDPDRLSLCLLHLQLLTPCSIVVIDSFFNPKISTICSEYNVIYTVFSWNGLFPKKRNWFLLELSQYHSEWTLFVDTDELITKQFAQEVLALIYSQSSTKANLYYGSYTTYFLGKKLHFGIPFRKTCLCKTGYALYESIPENAWSKLDMEVHEHLVPLTPSLIPTIKSPINHHEATSHYDRILRHNEYSSWQARLSNCISYTPSSPNIRSFLKHIFQHSFLVGPLYFLLNYFVFLGFLDGRRGLLYSLFKLSYINDIAIKRLECKEDFNE